VQRSPFIIHPLNFTVMEDESMPPENFLEKLHTQKQVMRILGASESTIQRWRTLEENPLIFIKLGNYLRCDDLDLKRFMWHHRDKLNKRKKKDGGKAIG
jgi:hypothetical protein